MRFIQERGIGLAWGALAMAAQMSGYTNTAIALGFVALAAFFFIAPVLHHAHAWQISRRRMGKRAVEPVHLVVAGLVGVIVFASIALVGVIWQSRRGPLLNAEIVSLRSQLDTASAELDTAKTALANGSDTPLTKLLFRQQQIALFKQKFDECVARIDEYSQRALAYTKQPPPGPPPLAARTKGLWENELNKLQKLVDDFFGEHISLSLPEDPFSLTSKVLGDETIQDYDTKQQYRRLWFKQRNENGLINAVRDRLNAEVRNLNENISGAK